MIVFSVYSILCSLVIFDLVDEGIDEDAAWVWVFHFLGSFV